MFCKKCGKELPDLTMYCTYCGAPQFGTEKQEVNLELKGSDKSRVIIKSYSNLTNAITVIRDLTGLDIANVRKLLAELPAIILDKVDEATAKGAASRITARIFFI